MSVGIEVIMNKISDNVLNIIKTRRSVRRYKSQEVPEECLNKILEAARWSPSAVNRQPWRFIVVRDKEIRKKLGDSARFYFVVNRQVSDAPVIIAVCAKDKEYKWAAMDCAMASQNIMLEAHSLGLGSCFIGGFDEGKVKEILGLPDKMKVFALITLGYPDGEVETPPRLEIDEIVFHNVYEQKDKSFGVKNILTPKSGTLSVIAKILKRK